MMTRTTAVERVRPAAVAGLFYASDARALASDVARLLADVPPSNDRLPKALIVPHAGYTYSGPVAARAYARLRDALGAATIRRVVLLGPAHRAYVRGFALPDADRFETPLGSVAVDGEALRELAELPAIAFDDVAHAAEHSLEVQLPFLQTVLETFSLVPIAVGDAGGDDVAAVLERVWGGDETLVVVSSDLSHYLPYRDARAVDARTVDTILRAARDLDHEQACGATPINGLIRCARLRQLAAELLDYRNSGDTAGDRNRVVGYASLAFERDERMRGFDV